MQVHGHDWRTGPCARSHLVSPYFVPTAAGVQALAALRQDGIRVLGDDQLAVPATDVAAGARGLREAAQGAAATRRGALRDAARPRRAPAPHGCTRDWAVQASSLHAKTFAVDRTRVYVGSFNFDPRSALLNTEMGLIIDSPPLARQIEQAFDAQIPGQSYRVQLLDSGKLQWQSGQADSSTPPTVYTVEPGSNWLSRWGMRALALLPIEWLL